LDDVIQAYMASATDSGEDTLDEWIGRYPQYERELRDFAAYWKMFGRLLVRDYNAEEEDALVARAASVVQNILHEQRGSASAAQPLSSLVDEAERQHMSLDRFAEAAEMSVPMIVMLDRRQVRYESIPRKAVESIAGVLRKLVAAVDSYLKGDMQFAPAHYRSDEPPKAASQCDFSYVVEIDPDLNDEQKERWLALTPQPEAGGAQGRERSA
jgi:hypothetical protein